MYEVTLRKAGKGKYPRAAFNALIREVMRQARWDVAPPLSLAQTSAGNKLSLMEWAADQLLVEVTSPDVISTNAKVSMCARVLNDDIAGPDFPVKTLHSMDDGDRFYAFRPRGGAMLSSGVDLSPVGAYSIEWMDTRRPGQLYEVELTSDGGDDGGDSGTTSWTYTVHMAGDEFCDSEVALGEAPTRIDNIRRDAATRGWASFDNKGDISLLIALESLHTPFECP